MGFNFLSAAGGAAKKYSENVKKVRDNQMALFNDQMTRTLDSFDKAIADRTSKTTELKRIGRQLESMGLNTDQALVVLGGGADVAKETIKKLEMARGADPQFNASDYITLANPEVTGMSLDDGISNIMGIVSSESLPSAAPESQYRSVRGLQSGAYANLESQYGMSMDEIRNTAFGNFEYGATPSGTLSPKLDEAAGLALRKERAAVTTAEVDAGAAQEMSDLRIRILESDADIKEVDAENAASVAKKKLTLLDQEISKGEWDESTRETRFAQIAEKHNREMAQMEQQYKGENLKQAVDAVKLQWQGDILNAELKYKQAQTAAEEADAAGGGTSLKSTDARGIYNSQFENYIKTGALGKFELVNGVPTLPALDPAGEAAREAKVQEWHDQMFASMVSEFGMNPTVMSLYKANSNKDILQFSIDYSKPASAAIAEAFTSNEAIMFDDKGNRFAVVQDEDTNEFRYIPYNEYARN
jgi:hypothetical protein